MMKFHPLPTSEVPMFTIALSILATVADQAEFQCDCGTLSVQTGADDFMVSCPACDAIDFMD